MLSRLGLGTVQFGLNYGLSNPAGRPSEVEIAAQPMLLDVSLMPFARIEDRRAYQRRYGRARMKTQWDRFRAAGGCGDCGRPVSRFTRCNQCRQLAAARTQRYRQRRTARDG